MHKVFGHVLLNDIFNLAQQFAEKVEVSAGEITAMPVVVTEKEDEYILEGKLPDGISKEDVDVSIKDGRLKVNVRKGVEPLREGESVCYDERQKVNISREFSFHNKVTADGHSAKVEHGKVVIFLKKVKAPEDVKIVVS